MLQLDQAEAYEHINAKTDLRKKVREIPMRSDESDPVARAEAALGALSQHFDEWMEDEISKITRNWTAWIDTGRGIGEAREAFYRTVHDLKGQGATLGFPLAARAAASLCGVLDQKISTPSASEALIDSHVEAIRAIFRERVKDEHDPVGSALVAALGGVAETFLTDRDLAADFTV